MLNQPYNFSLRRIGRANLNIIIPKAVPTVLLITSRRDESLVGRYTCVSSIPRLMKKPRNKEMAFAIDKVMFLHVVTRLKKIRRG